MVNLMKTDMTDYSNFKGACPSEWEPGYNKLWNKFELLFLNSDKRAVVLQYILEHPSDVLVSSLVEEMLTSNNSGNNQAFTSKCFEELFKKLKIN